MGIVRRGLKPTCSNFNSIILIIKRGFEPHLQLLPVQMVGGAGRESEESWRTSENEIADVGTQPLLINRVAERQNEW